MPVWNDDPARQRRKIGMANATYKPTTPIDTTAKNATGTGAADVDLHESGERQHHGDNGGEDYTVHRHPVGVESRPVLAARHGTVAAERE